MEQSSTFKLTLMREGGDQGGWAFLLELPCSKQNKKTPSKVLCTMQTNYFHGKFNYCDPNW